MKYTLKIAVPLAALAVWATSAVSHAQLVSNGGFEASSTSLSPWVTTGFVSTNGADSGIDPTPSHSHSGNNNAYIYDDGSQIGAGTTPQIYQTISLTADTAYVLTGWVNDDNAPGLIGVEAIAGDQTTAIASDPLVVGTGGGYLEYTVDFNSSSFTSLSVFAGYTVPGSSSYINMDDFSVTPAEGAVPEPTTWGLMLGGLAGLFMLARRNWIWANV